MIKREQYLIKKNIYTLEYFLFSSLPVLPQLIEKQDGATLRFQNHKINFILQYQNMEPPQVQHMAAVMFASEKGQL